MRTEFFNQPDETVKSVHVYYTGSFPKSTKPDKDVTLPKRLWPNAKYYIRCKLQGSAGEKNQQYFKKLYGWEYPVEYNRETEPFYPVNDQENNEKYHKYQQLAQEYPNIHFGGRLGQYKYYDMHQIIAAAFTYLKKI